MDITLPTDDDEDFSLDHDFENKYSSGVGGSGAHSGVKKLNFDDLQLDQRPSQLKNKSLSSNADLDDIDQIDPTTFSQKGDFIR